VWVCGCESLCVLVCVFGGAQSRARREFRYAFDVAFDETASQRIVFERTTKTLIKSVMAGYNATVQVALLRFILVSR
jgi:hypothetical protein